MNELALRESGGEFLLYQTEDGFEAETTDSGANEKGLGV